VGVEKNNVEVVLTWRRITVKLQAAGRIDAKAEDNQQGTEIAE
jgi:hypothetical protein